MPLGNCLLLVTSDPCTSPNRSSGYAANAPGALIDVGCSSIAKPGDCLLGAKEGLIWVSRGGGLLLLLLPRFDIIFKKVIY